MIGLCKNTVNANTHNKNDLDVERPVGPRQRLHEASLRKLRLSTRDPFATRKSAVRFAFICRVCEWLQTSSKSLDCGELDWIQKFYSYVHESPPLQVCSSPLMVVVKSSGPQCDEDAEDAAAGEIGASGRILTSSLSSAHTSSLSGLHLGGRLKFTWVPSTHKWRRPVKKCAVSHAGRTKRNDTTLMDWEAKGCENIEQYEEEVKISYSDQTQQWTYKLLRKCIKCWKLRGMYLISAIFWNANINSQFILQMLPFEVSCK